MVAISHSTYYVNQASDRFEGNWLASLVTLSRQLWIGVPIFFVISGYCISATADACRLQEKPILDYFIRRFRRIFPAYWAWLSIVALLVWIVESRLAIGFLDDGQVGIPNPSTLNVWQWFGNFTLTEVWRAGYIGGSKNEILGHCWSLSYEEQFYVVTGLVLLFARKRFFMSFAIISLAVIFTSLILPRFHLHVPGVFLNAKWLMFAAGILVYYVVNYAGNNYRKWAFLALFFAGAYAAREPHKLFQALINDIDQSLLVASIFAVLAIALHPLDARLRNATFLKPLRFCGTICYSLYLVHWPIVKITSKLLSGVGLNSYATTLMIVIPVCLAISVCVARAFHLAIERHFLNAPAWEEKTGKNLPDANRSLPLSAAENAA
ncbi:MAG: putative acyltransferase [Verrucomicrobiales bacterium]|nr:putative acyltransferase [Verrucomicrobiales bacterium]